MKLLGVAVEFLKGVRIIAITVRLAIRALALIAKGNFVGLVLTATASVVLARGKPPSGIFEICV
jgi:hypothetical protein